MTPPIRFVFPFQGPIEVVSGRSTLDCISPGLGLGWRPSREQVADEKYGAHYGNFYQ